MGELDARKRRLVITTLAALLLATSGVAYFLNGGRPLEMGVGFVVLAVAGLFGWLGRSDVAADAQQTLEMDRTNRFLHAVIQNIPHMVFVKDAEHLAFQKLNAAGEQLLGVREADMLGKTDFDFFDEERARFFQAKDRETLALETPLDIPEELIQTPRGPRWLHTKKVALRTTNGGPFALLGISEDITERKAQDDALRATKERLEEANRELETFSYSVSHDLRAPLRSIDGFSQALLEDYADQLDSTGQDYLRRIRSGAQRMAALIDDLLGLARVNRAELHHERVDLSALSREVLRELAATQKDRQVAIDIPEGLYARGDPRLLKIVLDNLLGNAWKFTAQKDRPTISLGLAEPAQERDPAFFVRDNGVGFDMAYAHKLFAPFQRLHGANDFPGTGIGLATVARIVHRHGGKVWADASPGVGATFYFSLPEALRA